MSQDSTDPTAEQWSETPPPASPPPAAEASPAYEQPAYQQPAYQQPAYQQPAYQQPAGYQASAAPLTPEQERNLGMLSHVIPAAALVLSGGTLGFVASLVIYLMYRDRGPFVRAHAANSLNIQIMTGIGLLVSIPLMLVLVGFLTFGIVLVAAVVMHIVGAQKANSGEWWNPPAIPRMLT